MFAERKDKKPRADTLLVQNNEIFVVSNLAFAAKNTQKCGYQCEICRFRTHFARKMRKNYGIISIIVIINY